MQITITYVAGHTPSSEIFTGCTNYTRDANWVSFTGTDAGGVTKTYDIRASTVDRVEKTGAGG